MFKAFGKKPKFIGQTVVTVKTEYSFMGLLDQNRLAQVMMGEQYEFKIHLSSDSQFYWTLHNTRGNTEPVAVSERYTSKHNAQHSISQVMRLAGAAKITDTTTYRP